jgi:hypothetical protein
MLQLGPQSSHYCRGVMLHSSIVMPPVGHSSNHQYHCCQLTGQASSVLNFYRTFKVFISLPHTYQRKFFFLNEVSIHTFKQMVYNGFQDNWHMVPQTAAVIHYNTLTTSVSWYILTNAMFAQWHTYLMPCLFMLFPLSVIVLCKNSHTHQPTR